MISDNSSLTRQGKRQTTCMFLKFAFIATLVVGVLTSLFYANNKDAVIRHFQSTDTQRLEMQIEQISNDVGRIASDVVLAANYVHRELVERSSDYEDLSREFSILLWGVEHCDQLRLIDSSGLELIRVHRGASGPIINSDDELQNKRLRPYFIEAIEMNYGELYLSHLELNQEHGQIQVPYNPVLRIATPVYLDKDKTHKSVVVLNCNARELLGIDNTRKTISGGQMLMITSQGYWIRGLEASDEWGHLISGREGKTFATAFPEDWLRLSASSSGQFLSKSGLFTYGSIIPSDLRIFQNRKERIMHIELQSDDGGGSLEWKVISFVSADVLNAEISAATRATLLFAAVSLFFILIICWFIASTISTRKKALKDLEKNEALNRSIIKTATDAIIIIDAKGVMQSFNEAATKTFGYSEQQAVGQNVKLLMPEMHARHHDQQIHGAIKSKDTTRKVVGASREVQGRRADGSFFPLEISVSSFEVQGQIMFTGVVRDITDRKNADSKIALLALFGKYNPNPLIRFAASGAILDANPAAKKLWGLEPIESLKVFSIFKDISDIDIIMCVENGRVITRNISIDGRHYIVMLKGISSMRVGQLYAFDVTERREAEMTAVELGRILDGSVNGVFVIDIETMKFVMVNRAACANLGYKLDELLGRTPMSINRAQSNSISMHHIVKPLLNGEIGVLHFTTEHVRKDGTFYPAEITVQLTTFNSRPVLAAFVVDVTEKIEAERLRIELEREYESEEFRKRDIIDGLFKKISVKTGTELFHELTAELAKRLEVNYALVGELIGDDNQRILAHSLFSNGERSSNYEYNLAGTPCAVTESVGFCSIARGAQECFPNDDDLSTLNVQSYIGARLVASDGKPIGIILIMSSEPIRDIEFKESVVKIFAVRAASELERMQTDRQARRLAQAVSSASDIVIITDEKANITYVNSAFETITGYSSAESVGKNPRFLQSNRQDRTYYQDMWSSLESEGVWSGSIVNKRKDGSFYTAEISITSILDERGRLTSYVSLERDVTAQKETERRLRQAQKMEAIGALAGGIAHDFNNILMGITGFTEMVYDELPEGSSMAEDLKEALAGGSRAKELVQQILTFSRQHESEQKPVMMHLMVKEALKLLNATLPENIKVVQNIPVDCGLIKGDPTQIHQVTMNLCTNAFHAIGEKDGSISVSLEVVTLDDNSDTRLADLPYGEYLTLTVSDTGCGMDSEVQSRIFEPFFTTKKVGEGTGMGLATVYGIVQDCQGEILVDSKLGVGTTIKVYLPRLAGELLEENSIGELEANGKERILVVEDDEPALKVTRKMLGKLGYQVSGFSHPLEALEYFKHNSDDFDLIITDKTMPNMSGLEFAQGAHQARYDIPIILLTGYAESISNEVAKKLGFSALLAKPISAKSLGREIQAVLKKINISALS